MGMYVCVYVCTGERNTSNDDNDAFMYNMGMHACMHVHVHKRTYGPTCEETRKCAPLNYAFDFWTEIVVRGLQGKHMRVAMHKIQRMHVSRT